MIIRLTKTLSVDMTNIPSDFEEQVIECFKKFTEGTAKEYMYQDKLMFIDVMRKNVHEPYFKDDPVIELMKGRLQYHAEVEGEVIDKEELLSIEFMKDCYNLGRTNLYNNYENIYGYNKMSHLSDKIMKVLYRAIYAVMNYENE